MYILAVLLLKKKKLSNEWHILTNLATIAIVAQFCQISIIFHKVFMKFKDHNLFLTLYKIKFNQFIFSWFFE